MSIRNMILVVLLLPNFAWSKNLMDRLVGHYQFISGTGCFIQYQPTPTPMTVLDISFDNSDPDYQYYEVKQLGDMIFTNDIGKIVRSGKDGYITYTSSKVKGDKYIEKSKYCDHSGCGQWETVLTMTLSAQDSILDIYSVADFSTGAPPEMTCRFKRL